MSISVDLSKCGYIIKGKTINNIRNNGFTCPSCGDGISYPNKFMLHLLDSLNVNFEREVRFNWCKYIDVIIERA